MVKPNHLTVRCGSCNDLVKPNTPTYRLYFILAGMITLGGAGLFAGLVVGVATAGFGTAAWVFTIPLGLYGGYKIGGWTATTLNGYSCPECGEYFKSPSITTRLRNAVPI